MNSSDTAVETRDWIAALTAGGPDAVDTPEQPIGWIGALSGLDGFVEGVPFVGPKTAPVSVPEQAGPIQHDVVPDTAAPAPDPVEVAHAQGMAEGRAAAMAERTEEEAQRRKLQLSLRALDQAGMDALAIDLAATVRDLCAQVISDHMPDPARLRERCAQAAKLLGGSVADCALHLHPDDIALIEPSALEQWRIVADPGVERGGLLFEGRDGAVSDRPEDWRRALATSVGA